jgi:hypothetical protein
MIQTVVLLKQFSISGTETVCWKEIRAVGIAVEPVRFVLYEKLLDRTR